MFIIYVYKRYYNSKMSMGRVSSTPGSGRVKIFVNFGGLDWVENSVNAFISAFEICYFVFKIRHVFILLFTLHTSGACHVYKTLHC